MNRLGELERAIMEVLWESPDPMTVRQVGGCLTDRDLAHTTVMTVLDRLAKKGFVRRQRAGRAWRYRPAESREAYVAELMLTALDQTGDRQAALTRFARSVSGAEADALREALEALSGGGTGLRSAIVISAGALDLLDQAELAAVLAHERAHLRARHDLVLLPFTALLRAFRWSAVARDANREVALLVEMMADDRAQRRLPARELATALLRVGAYGGGRAPTGALAIIR